jgi:Zn-dependent peptidase ImmA (M78 family)
VAQRVEAIVEPALLIWAREKAGFEIEAAAAKARNVSADRLAAWERGERRPTIAQLRELGRIYKRPIAVFYLPRPPRDFPPIKDYRVAWEKEQTPPSPELLAEIEAAYERREIALELGEDEEQPLPRFAIVGHIDENPDVVAARLRHALGIELDEQFEWGDARTAFNAWRIAAENVGALVLQMTGVEQREARGFSIAEKPLPAIVVNNRDPFGARSFTIAHELAHAAIHQSGICDLGNRGGRIEPFCNHVAGAILVPAQSLIEDGTVREHPATEPVWRDDELERLGRYYKVSREVILRRLLILGRTDDAFYRRKRRELLAEYEQRKAAADDATWGPSPATMAVARAGYYFSRLVLRRYHDGAINASDVAVYLGVRMKHVPSIERAVFSPTAGA